MASNSLDKDGTRRLVFSSPNGKRPTIRLGRMAPRDAERLKAKVAQLEIATKHGTPLDAETAAWASKLPSTMYDKLAKHGMLPKRVEPARTTLQAFLDGYIAERVDVKGSTATVYGHTRRCLVEFFGADRPLQNITPGDADRFRLHLFEQDLASNTINRRCSIAKQFFRAAQRRKLIAENPFADLGASVKGNPDKFYFLSREDAQKITDACPDSQWRLIFALSRWGGLRCPSEHLGLTWADVDWERGRMRVRSPKTEHHEGKAERLVPIFPELRPYLEEVWEQAEPGIEFVITRYRAADQNLRTTFQKIIARAGLTAWPKLFQNLRSTRETELAQEFPIHVVTAWLGNTVLVATKHYLQVTDADFERAQNRGQYGAEMARTDSQAAGSAREKSPGFPGFATGCNSLRSSRMGDTGLEPVTPSLSS